MSHENSPCEDASSTDVTTDFSRLIEAGLDRRGFLSAIGAGSAATFLGPSVAAAQDFEPGEKFELLGFRQIPPSTADQVIVPLGYRAEVLISWGDPMFSNAPEFDQQASAETQEHQFGDDNDGMSFFPIDEDHGVLAINNENTNHRTLFAHGRSPMSKEEVAKDQAAHGVSIIEVERSGKSWQVQRNGSRNRRITGNTPMDITGPAAGNWLMKTDADPSGRRAWGTLNNCANGMTPWGTYLTCEENFHFYFGTDGELKFDSDAPIDLEQNYKLYKIGKNGTKSWHKYDERFDLAKNKHEPHRFGWIVEIDPMDPLSTPKKRTALGRFKHENAALVINKDNRVVVYMGDDECGEHIYKFVSQGRYVEGDDANNRGLLETGTLYVAQFAGKEGEFQGTGRWIELTWGKNGIVPENGFPDPGSVAIFARRAAKIVGATTMDRPEWVAVHPDFRHVFCTLTNNSERGSDVNQPINAANPRTRNNFGHIIRWYAENGNHASPRFHWDLYLLAGNPIIYGDDPRGGSESINRENMFNSPDGLAFDKAGRLWILTDGNTSNQGEFAGMGNNQMLCGDPRSGEVRRFLTGPVGCEITGVTFAPDYKTMFVGVQHPTAHFPEGGNSLPRSSVMMITRNDGGVIGEPK